MAYKSQVTTRRYLSSVTPGFPLPAPVSNVISLPANPAQNADYVQFLIDGNLRGTLPTWGLSSPYSFGVDSATITNGVHNVQAVAYRGPSRDFDPVSAIPSCKLHLDFSNLSTITGVINSGDRVTQIVDRSGVCQPFVANVGTGVGPVWTNNQFNGLGCVNFGASINTILRSSTIFNHTQGDVFIVYYLVNNSQLMLCSGSLSGSANFLEFEVQNISGTTNKMQVAGDFAGTLRIISGNTIPINSLHVGNWRCDSLGTLGSASYKFWDNGVLGTPSGTPNDGSKWFGALTGANNLTVGGLVYGGGNLGSAAIVGEIIVCNALLSDSARAQVDAYLAQKWLPTYSQAGDISTALSLPSNWNGSPTTNPYATPIVYTPTAQPAGKINVQNPGAPTPYTFESPMDWINLYLLYFSGVALSPADGALLNTKTSMADIASTAIAQTAAAAGTVAKLLQYWIISKQSYYHTLDWNGYADLNGLDRELAFWHQKAGAYKPVIPDWGNGGASFPTTWFWDAYTITNGGAFADLFAHGVMGPAVSGTSGAGGSYLNDGTGVPFSTAAGDCVVFGQHERFDEIWPNLTVASVAPWNYVIEYPSARNDDGTPRTWSPCIVLSDATSGFTVTGSAKKIQIDPFPELSNQPVWVTTYADQHPQGHGLIMYGSQPAFTGPGGVRGYYVRIRTLSNGGTAPVATTITTADFTGAGNDANLSLHSPGVLPWNNGNAKGQGFDIHNVGYLNNTQFAAFVAAGGSSSAPRFQWMSRVPTLYGMNCIWANFTDPRVKAWVVNQLQRVVAVQPVYDGYRLDDMSGQTGFSGQSSSNLVESDANFVNDYKAVLTQIRQATAKIYMLNMGSVVVAGTEGAAPGAWQENQILDNDGWFAFEGHLTIDRATAMLATPPVLQAIASFSTVTITDLQRMLFLAAYYCLATEFTMYNPFGNNNATSGWINGRWCNAILTDIGQPNGPVTLLAAGAGGFINIPTGADPNDSSTKTYRVYQRDFTNALVLYRPLSDNGSGAVGVSATGSVTHQLPGYPVANYYQLNADGSRNPVATATVSLTNGSAAILMKSPI